MSTPPPPGSGDRPWDHGAGDVRPQQGGYPYPPQSGYPYPPQTGPSPYGGHGAVVPGDPLVATSFSDWWSKVIGVLRRSWQPLLAIQLATVVPGMIIGAVVTAAAATGSTVVSFAGAVVGLIGVLIVFVVALLAQGASVYVVGKQASGQEAVGAGPALRFAASRALPLLGWGILAAILVGLGLILLVVPGIYLLVVFAAALTGVIMFEQDGIGRTFALVNPAFGQTLGRLLSFALVALVYSAIVGWIVTALVGPEGFVSQLLGNILTLPVTFASVGVGVVTYASLRHRENPAVTTPVLAAELDRP